MPDLIIFMSLHGCAEKAALIFREMSRNDVLLINLRKMDPPPLDDFKTVIIGGSVHMSSIQGKIKKFCQDNEAELLKKRLGLYICHMQEGSTAVRQFNDAFSEKLRDHAVAKGLFGGEFNFEKMDKYEKELVKKTTGTEKTIQNINREAIEGFGRVIFGLDKS
jgi:menaquinone-dependent protoporphyrinogen oxidase